MPPCPAAAKTFSETQMGIIPADPTNPEVLLRSWVYLPELFFKDEGSKDRCMEAEVALVAADKENAAAPPSLVKGIKLHLNVYLVYVDYVLAPEFCSSGGRRRAGGTQLLHVSSATVRHIDPATGRAKIKFRVNDVSKNHDGRCFRLAVSADLSETLSGEARGLIDGPLIASQVASAYTHGIEVRSKRRKTKPKAASSVSGSVADFEDVRGGSRASSGGGLSAATAAASAMLAAEMAATAPRPHTTMHAPAGAVAGAGSTDGVPRGPAGRQLRRCMNEVVNWSNNVLDLLQHKLQWHTFKAASGKSLVHCIVCNAQSDDPATANHFPDCKLRGAISQYADSTRASITALVRHVHGEQNTLAAQRKAQLRKSGAAIPAARANSMEHELGGNTSVPRSANLSSGLSPHDMAVTQDAVQSLVQLRNSPPVNSGGPPPLTRDESAGTMFVRVARQGMHGGGDIPPGQHPLMQHSSSSGSIGVAVGGSKRSRDGGGFGGDASKRPAGASAHDGHWGDDMGPAVLEREGSRASYASMGGGAHDMGRVGTAFLPSHGTLARLPSGVMPPQPPTLMQQASFARQESGGWPMHLSRQDSAGSWGTAPAARVHGGGAGVPPPPSAQAFLRGTSSRTPHTDGGRSLSTRE